MRLADTRFTDEKNIAALRQRGRDGRDFVVASDLRAHTPNVLVDAVTERSGRTLRSVPPETENSDATDESELTRPLTGWLAIVLFD